MAEHGTLKFHIRLAASDSNALCGYESAPWVLFKEFALLAPSTVCDECRVVAEREGLESKIRK